MLVNHLEGQLDRAKALLTKSEQRNIALANIIRAAGGGYGGRPMGVGGMPMGAGMGMPMSGMGGGSPMSAMGRRTQWSRRPVYPDRQSRVRRQIIARSTRRGQRCAGHAGARPARAG